MPARVAAIHPLRAIESGRITIEGSGFPIEESSAPSVRIGTTSFLSEELHDGMELVAARKFANNSKLEKTTRCGFLRIR